MKACTAIVALTACALVSAQSTTNDWYIQRSQEYLQTVAWHLVNDIYGLGPALQEYIDAETFTRTAGPGSLGLVQDAPASAVDALFVTFYVDPLVEYQMNITTATSKTTDEGVTVAMSAVGGGVRTSGKPYKQEYLITMKYNAEGKVYHYTEFLDGFASACYIGSIPADVCAENGLSSA